MRALYVFLYYFSLVYLVLAGVNVLIALSVMFWEKKHYWEQFSQFGPGMRTVIAVLVPVIYGLGWIIFVPKVVNTAFFSKGK